MPSTLVSRMEPQYATVTEVLHDVSSHIKVGSACDVCVLDRAHGLDRIGRWSGYRRVRAWAAWVCECEGMDGMVRMNAWMG